MKPVWTKVLLFAAVLFLIRLADGIISFWAPNEIQGFLSNSVVMGFIISFQSVVGFLADLIFPHLLKATKVKRMLFWAIIMSALTSLFLVSASVKPFVAIFLVTMLLWGIYYELVAFANYRFMGAAVPAQMRSGAWGVMGIFSNFAYFLGPLLATGLLLKGAVTTEVVILILLGTGGVLLALTRKSHDPTVLVDLKETNPFLELKYWFTLVRIVWPAVVMSLLFGIIDATFWTTGAVWTEKLAATNPLGSLFLPLYQLPPIFLGLVVAKWGIAQGKKKWVERLLLVAGIILAAMIAVDSLVGQLILVFLSSCALALCYPLLEGVYTDIVARMGKEKDHLIGLTSSSLNLAYVIWPPVAGFLAMQLGERLTFSYLGYFVAVVAVLLLWLTPKKLRLPQAEIQSWHT